MSNWSPNTAMVRKEMYVSWIRANPEIAETKIRKFCEDATKQGMRLRMVQSEHYVNIIAAYTDDCLFGNYA